MKRHQTMSIITTLTVLLTVSTSIAASTRCVVEEVNDDQVILRCEKTDDLLPGIDVKLKVKKEAIEGC